MNYSSVLNEILISGPTDLKKQYLKKFNSFKTDSLVTLVKSDKVNKKEDEINKYKRKINWSLNSDIGTNLTDVTTYQSKFGVKLISKLLNFLNKKDKASENDKNEIYHLLDRFIALKYANAIQQQVQERENDLKQTLLGGSSSNNIEWFTQRNKYVMRIIERFCYTYNYNISIGKDDPNTKLSLTPFSEMYLMEEFGKRYDLALYLIQIFNNYLLKTGITNDVLEKILNVFYKEVFLVCYKLKTSLDTEFNTEFKNFNINKTTVNKFNKFKSFFEHPLIIKYLPPLIYNLKNNFTSILNITTKIEWNTDNTQVYDIIKNKLEKFTETFLDSNNYGNIFLLFHYCHLKYDHNLNEHISKYDVTSNFYYKKVFALIYGFNKFYEIEQHLFSSKLKNKGNLFNEYNYILKQSVIRNMSDILGDTDNWSLFTKYLINQHTLTHINSVYNPSDTNDKKYINKYIFDIYNNSVGELNIFIGTIEKEEIQNYVLSFVFYSEACCQSIYPDNQRDYDIDVLVADIKPSVHLRKLRKFVGDQYLTDVELDTNMAVKTAFLYNGWRFFENPDQIARHQLSIHRKLNVPPIGWLSAFYNPIDDSLAYGARDDTKNYSHQSYPNIEQMVPKSIETSNSFTFVQYIPTMALNIENAGTYYKYKFDKLINYESIYIYYEIISVIQDNKRIIDQLDSLRIDKNTNDLFTQITEEIRVNNNKIQSDFNALRLDTEPTNNTQLTEYQKYLEIEKKMNNILQFIQSIGILTEEMETKINEYIELIKNNVNNYVVFSKQLGKLQEETNYIAAQNKAAIAANKAAIAANKAALAAKEAAAALAANKKALLELDAEIANGLTEKTEAARGKEEAARGKAEAAGGKEEAARDKAEAAGLAVTTTTTDARTTAKTAETKKNFLDIALKQIKSDITQSTSDLTHRLTVRKVKYYTAPPKNSSILRFGFLNTPLSDFNLKRYIQNYDEVIKPEYEKEIWQWTYGYCNLMGIKDEDTCRKIVTTFIQRTSMVEDFNELKFDLKTKLAQEPTNSQTEELFNSIIKNSKFVQQLMLQHSKNPSNPLVQTNSQTYVKNLFGIDDIQQHHEFEKNISSKLFSQSGGAHPLLLQRVDGYSSLSPELYHSVYKNYDHILPQFSIAYAKLYQLHYTNNSNLVPPYPVNQTHPYNTKPNPSKFLYQTDIINRRFSLLYFFYYYGKTIDEYNGMSILEQTSIKSIYFDMVRYIFNLPKYYPVLLGFDTLKPDNKMELPFTEMISQEEFDNWMNEIKYYIDELTTEELLIFKNNNNNARIYPGVEGDIENDNNDRNEMKSILKNNVDKFKKMIKFLLKDTQIMTTSQWLVNLETNVTGNFGLFKILLNALKITTKITSKDHVTKLFEPDRRELISYELANPTPAPAPAPAPVPDTKLNYLEEQDEPEVAPTAPTPIPPPPPPTPYIFKTLKNIAKPLYNLKPDNGGLNDKDTEILNNIKLLINENDVRLFKNIYDNEPGVNINLLKEYVEWTAGKPDIDNPHNDRTTPRNPQLRYEPLNPNLSNEHVYSLIIQLIEKYILNNEILWNDKTDFEKHTDDVTFTKHYNDYNNIIPIINRHHPSLLQYDSYIQKICKNQNKTYNNINNIISTNNNNNLIKVTQDLLSKFDPTKNIKLSPLITTRGKSIYGDNKVKLYNICERVFMKLFPYSSERITYDNDVKTKSHYKVLELLHNVIMANTRLENLNDNIYKYDYDTGRTQTSKTLNDTLKPQLNKYLTDIFKRISTEFGRIDLKYCVIDVKIITTSSSRRDFIYAYIYDSIKFTKAIFLYLIYLNGMKYDDTEVTTGDKEGLKNKDLYPYKKNEFYAKLYEFKRAQDQIEELEEVDKNGAQHSFKFLTYEKVQELFEDIKMEYGGDNQSKNDIMECIKLIIKIILLEGNISDKDVEDLIIKKQQTGYVMTGIPPMGSYTNSRQGVTGSTYNPGISFSRGTATFLPGNKYNSSYVNSKIDQLDLDFFLVKESELEAEYIKLMTYPLSNKQLKLHQLAHHIHKIELKERNRTISHLKIPYSIFPFIAPLQKVRFEVIDNVDQSRHLQFYQYLQQGEFKSNLGSIIEIIEFYLEYLEQKKINLQSEFIEAIKTFIKDTKSFDDRLVSIARVLQTVSSLPSAKSKGNRDSVNIDPPVPIGTHKLNPGHINIKNNFKPHDFDLTQNDMKLVVNANPLIQHDAHSIYKNPPMTPNIEIEKALTEMKADSRLLELHLEKAYKLEKIIRQDIDVQSAIRGLVHTFYLM